MDVSHPAFIDRRLDSRSVTAENPTGERGAGGVAHGGRKGAPNRRVEPGARIVLADLDGPGVVRHWWMTYPPSDPETMRSLWMEVFYDGAAVPSVSVPCLDFFGLPHGRPAAYHSALTAANEGRGFNAWFPMPFRRGMRVEVINAAALPVWLFYQLDYTRQPVDERLGYLHVAFRRENPTVMGRDFVIAEGLAGPGRFLGCNVGVRVLDEGNWYGEGEVKVYRDGDGDLPTICGTGLEDYVGSAWGLGPHHAPYGGAPLVVEPPRDDHGPSLPRNPALVGFYRWHVADPIMFERELRVTIQQIGAAFFVAGEEEAFEEYARSHPAAGAGWNRPGGALAAWGIAERVDDYCATAYTYCMRPQPVPRLDVAAALADIGWRDHEPRPPTLPAGLLPEA